MKKFLKFIILFIIIFNSFSVFCLARTNEETTIAVKYKYDEHSNSVIVTIESDTQLKNTKPTWTLSQDKLIYTKQFFENTNYDTFVEDINGNEKLVNINVNQIKKFSCEVKYQYDEGNNQVKALINSSIELKNTKPTWILSQDKLVYTKIFTENAQYETNVEDKFGNILVVKIDVNQIHNKNSGITIKYEYNELNNKTIVKVTSNIKFKNTKPTWSLSQDELVYTKEFNENCNYITSFIDKNDNITDVNIIVEQIKKFNISVNYIYNNENNTVIAEVISSMKLNDTKPTWTLSGDKYKYTKIFDYNIDYTTTFESVYEDCIDVNIKIKQIDEVPPQITVEYKWNIDDSVTVFLKSNKILKNTKPTWELNENKMIYIKVFNSDQCYNTTVIDQHGLETNVRIDFKIRIFKYDQDDGSVIKIRYLYMESRQVDVDIISPIKMSNTKPTWILSSDGYKYSKTFYENNIYETQINYVDGQVKKVNIIVNLFKKISRGIDVSYSQGKIDWQRVKNSGIDFAIIRCGYGKNISSQDDSYFLRNVAECKRLGIPYGVYIYSYALDIDSASSEADHTLRLLRLSNANPTLGVWFDMEDADGYKSRYGMPSNDMLVNICKTYCDKINQNGYHAGIYASLYWFENQLNNAKLDQYDKWVAHWASECGYKKSYKMWQYTSKGSVDGILNEVDMDILYR